MTVRILIVDDSKMMRSLVRRALGKAGFGDFPTDEAADGLEALEKIEQAPPQIVLSDWNMPNMDGMQLLQALKGDGLIEQFDIKFGFVTTETSDHRRQEAAAAGALFLLAKPFTPADVARVLAPYVSPDAAALVDQPAVEVEAVKKELEPEGTTGPATATPADKPAHRLRSEEAISDLLAMLMGEDVSVEAVPDRLVRPPVSVAVYQLDTVPTVGYCLCELRLGAAIAADLAGLPDDLVDAAVDDRALTSLPTAFTSCSTC